MAKSKTQISGIRADRITMMHGVLARDIGPVVDAKVLVRATDRESWEGTQIGTVRFHLINQDPGSQVFVAPSGDDFGGPVIEVMPTAAGRRRASSLRWW